MKTENLTDCALFSPRKDEPHVRLDDPRGCVPDTIAISSKVLFLHFESVLWADG